MLEINVSPIPQIFSFVDYRVPQQQINLASMLSSIKQNRGDHLFLNIVNNHILHPKKTEETTKDNHHR